MSHQPQRRRRRRRSRRPAQGQATPVASSEATSESSDADASPNAGRGGGRQRGNERAGGAPAKRTIFGLPRMSFAILAGLLIALIAMFGLQLAFPSDEVTEIRGVVSFADQGRRHLADGESFDDYNSAPPTSGPHHGEAPRPGVYGADQPAPFNVIPSPDEMLPLLESGGVVVYYDPDHPVADELLPWLRSLAGVRYNLSAVPVEGLTAMHDGAPVVAAAWRTLLPLPAPSEDDDKDELPLYRTLLEVFLSSGEEGYYERYVLDRDGQRELLAEAQGE